MSDTMNLYIWVDPYDVDYGSSLLVVVAASLEQAKELARSGKSYAYGKYENKTTPTVELGDPMRVLPIPCAEWHQWSE